MDNVDWGDLLFKFDGRINRGKFWLGVVIVAVVVWIVAIIAALTNSQFMYIVLGIVWLAAIWPGLALQIKRWHDRDKSGWWVLINFVPIIGGIWALVENGFLAGTPGPNQYGPDPLA